jgi:hypothetical protein
MSSFDVPGVSRELVRRGSSDRYDARGLYLGTPSPERGYERRGRFAGRGPKGYWRFARRLELSSRPTADADDI